MVKTVSSPSSLLAVLVAGVVALGVVWLLHLGHVEASSHSATRSFAPASASVPAGGELEVTITASDYGGFWGVEETLPDGFTYVEDSVAPSDVRVRVDGLTVSFTLLGGGGSFTYRVAVSDVAGDYTFTGTVTDAEREGRPVGGASSVAVTAGGGVTPDPTPDPTKDPNASRTLSPALVSPGGEIEINVTATDYGRFGAVVETLPAGFNYVEGSITPTDIRVAVDGQEVTFSLLDEESFTYRVTASRMEGSHSFSGTLEDDDRNSHVIEGDASVAVELMQGQGSRSFSASRVDPSDEFTVTITIAGDYGSIGQVAETLPTGLTYVEGSTDPTDIRVAVDGQTVTFVLLGEGSFTYRVASSDRGSYSFAGILTDGDRIETRVGGDSSIEVAPAPPIPGPPGPQGDTGAKGEPGAKGDTGAKGEPGAKGDTGAKGEPGAKGDTGAKGEPGAKGDTGAKGEPGAKGDTGAKGEPGAKGDTGAKGEPGAKGDTGAKGEPGAKGDTGAKGEPGAKGDTGAKGDSASIIFGTASLILGIIAIGAAGAVFIVGRRRS